MVFPIGIPKVKGAHTLKQQVTIFTLAAIHDEGFGRVGNIIYIHRYLLVFSKFPKEIFNQGLNIKGSTKVSAFIENFFSYSTPFLLEKLLALTMTKMENT